MVVSKANKHHKTLAGKAWKNKFGGISIKLNPGVVITSELLEDNWLNLNPIRSEKEWGDIKKGIDRSQAEREEEALMEDDFYRGLL